MTTLSPGSPLLGTAGSTATGSWMPWVGGPGQFAVSCADFNGATIRLEMMGPDGSTGVPVDNGTTNVTFTANGAGGFTLAPGTQIRAGIISAVPDVVAFARADAIPTTATLTNR